MLFCQVGTFVTLGGRMEKEMVEVEEEFNENEKESIGEKEEEVEDKQSVPRR